MCSTNFRTYANVYERTSKTYTSLNFGTKALLIFNEFHHQFYKKKIIPIDLTLLTPLALAHWIMQDGAKSTSGGLYLCNDSFIAEDTIRLANYMSDKFSIQFTTLKLQVIMVL